MASEDFLLARVEARKKSVRKKPYVLVSYAQSLDGAIGKAEERVVLSGEASMRLTHALRASCDAVAVGIGTVLSDDPRLTVRLVHVDAQPAAVVFDSTQRLPASSHLVASARSRRVVQVVCSPGEQQAHLRTLPSGVEVLTVAGNFHAAVDALHEVCGFSSIMVEGGARLLRSALPRADDILVTVAPVVLPTAGGKTIRPAFDDERRLKHPLVVDLDGDAVIYGELGESS
mmetsp:Transcript_33247/g.106133  ORF Transcript_33247/g.106133 Transcript_33247/m.106133 type:complete len:230 (-) Transcript_33247:94-783(-)